MRRLVLISLFLLVGILPLWLRSLFEAQSAYLRGVQLLEQGSYADGLSALSESLRWQAPGVTWSTKAYEVLDFELKKAQTSEERVLVLKSLHSGLSASRSNVSFFSGDQRLEVVRKNLLEELPHPAITEAPPPKLLWNYQLVSQLGFWTWIFATLAGCFWGVLPNGCIRSAPILRFGVTALLGYSVWIFGLLRS